MESYKLVNSKDCRNKAIRLGYKIFTPESDISFEKDCLLFLEESVFYTRNKPFCYSSNSFVEITQKDFLALPEPIKVGDYFFVHKTHHNIGIAKVFKLEQGKLYTSEHVFITGTLEFFSKRKLTKEQVELLCN